MMPHPAAPNAADVVQSCPNKSAVGLICNKPVDTEQHHCCGCRYGGGVDRRHAAVARCLADVMHSHSGTKVFVEQEAPALTRVVTASVSMRVILSSTSTALSHTWATRLWSQQPAPDQDTRPKELRKPNLTDIHT